MQRTPPQFEWWECSESRACLKIVVADAAHQ